MDPALFEGLSVYQDVVLAGQTFRRGVRDCDERWALIDPHLPRRGAVLDVGSNFGWFGLKICETRPECVVASVEADPRSALIQRKVLQSHDHSRIALLTARANRRMLARFAVAGQRFDAALCLSILHWLPDHRAFLIALGQLARRIVIEYPRLDEPDAGSQKVRREIGELDIYLRGLFPDRPLRQIGEVSTHLRSDCRRPIWLIDVAGLPVESTDANAGLDVAGLIDNGLSWPPRSWWLSECNRDVNSRTRPTNSQSAWLLTADGLIGRRDYPPQIQRRLEQLPEETLYPRRDQLRRRARRVAGRMFDSVLSPLGWA